MFEELTARTAMSAEAWETLAARKTILPWQELRRTFVEAVARDFAHWISPEQAHYRDQLLVASGRFDHGARLLCDVVPPAPLRILDIGSGNSGVALAFANDADHEVYTLDIVPNVQALALRRQIALPLRAIVGDGAALPFASESIDLVLLVDVLEHLPRPAETATEIIRVLRPGGRCIILTPARVPLLFARDPHFGIRGLLLFPNEVQRFIVNRLFRRRIKTPAGASHDAYDVEHIYWHADEIARLFPGSKAIDVLYDYPFAPPAGTFKWWWLKHPRFFYRALRYKLRRFQFGLIVIHKGAARADVPVYDRSVVP